MSAEFEARIRAKLRPFQLDGTEAVERIVLRLQSPSRPADLRRALATILRLHRDAIPIDVAVELLIEGLEYGSVK